MPSADLCIQKSLLVSRDLGFYFKKHPQRDELESNLKKILHTNGILGLEANSM